MSTTPAGPGRRVLPDCGGVESTVAALHKRNIGGQHLLPSSLGLERRHTVCFPHLCLSPSLTFLPGQGGDCIHDSTSNYDNKSQPPKEAILELNMQACDHCHRRKSRCDKVRPTCGFCAKSGLTCVFTDRSKEPVFRKEHVEALERKLRQAEAKNKALASDLARLRTAATNSTGAVAKETIATPSESIEVCSRQRSAFTFSDRINAILY